MFTGIVEELGTVAAVGDLGAESIDHLRRFKLADVTRLGDDVRLILTPLEPQRTP